MGIENTGGTGRGGSQTRPYETRPYTMAELMVTAAAREINDGDVVFVGMRLPLLGFQLAKSTHAPNTVGVYELGLTRDSPAPEPIFTLGDLASLAKRHIIIMAHEQRRFVPRVDYITSPGYGDGPGWRERVGLPRGGPAAVITTLGVLRFDLETREMTLASLHPGITVQNVLDATGWPLRVAPDVARTPEPTPAERAMLRRFDPTGF